MQDEYGFRPQRFYCEWCGYVAFALLVAFIILTYCVMTFPFEEFV